MSRIIIAQYQGVSWVSRIIKGRGLYSHTAAVLQDNSVLEAWYKGGVSHINYHSGLVHNLSKNHTPGTIVDLFYVDCTQKQADTFDKYVLAEVGKKYDFWSIWCFIIRKAAIINQKWFCSELVFEMLTQVGIYPQVRIKSSEVSPDLMGISPLLTQYDQVVTV